MQEGQYDAYKNTTHVNEKTHFSWPVVVVAVLLAAAWGANTVQMSNITETLKRLEAKSESQATKISNLELSIANLCSTTPRCKMVTK